MAILLSYLIRSIVISGVLTGYYLAALRNKRFHTFNRYYLLSSLFLSLVLPLNRLTWSPWKGPDDGPVRNVIAHLQVPVIRPYGDVHPYLEKALALSAIVSFGLLVVLAIRIIAVYRQKSQNPRQKKEGYHLVVTDDPSAPYSFFNNLFWRRGIDPDGPIGKRILTHELAHIRGHHSRDILFAQSAACIFWINPFFWFIRQELTMVHEFIADAACCPEGDTESFARMLLLSHNAGRYLDPSHAFFHSPIKRRLTMLIPHQQSLGVGLLKGLALPILLAFVAFISCSKEQTASHLNKPTIKLDDEQVARQKIESLHKKLPDNITTVHFNSPTIQRDHVQ